MTEMDYDTAAAKSAILGSLGSGSMRYGPGNDRLTGPLCGAAKAGAGLLKAPRAAR